MFIDATLFMNDGLPFSILVVDDDEDDREIIDDAFLELNAGAEIKKFLNAKMLFQYLNDIDASLYPSLIVLDNTLGEKQAVDILPQLKADPRFKDIRVLVYSSSISPAKRQELQSLGAYEVHEKGNRKSDVMDFVKRLLAIADDSRQDITKKEVP